MKRGWLEGRERLLLEASEGKGVDFLKTAEEG